MSYQKFPRTLNEAFGPYASDEFDDEPDALLVGWAITLVLSIAAFVCLVFYSLGKF